MKCIKCQRETQLIAVNDNPNRGYAYNVYHCLDCMIICHSNVWENKGDMWVYPDHSTEVRNTPGPL